MKTIKQILAVVGIVCLLLLYLVTFIAACFKTPAAQQLFRASLGCTILIPVFLYLVLMVARVVRPQKSPVIDTVIFDLGGVLVDFAWEEYAKAHGVSDETIDFMQEHVAYSAIWEKLDLGLSSNEEVIEEFCKAYPDYAEPIRLVLSSMEEACSLFWYTESWVNALIHQGYNVYFLSNWNRRNYELLMESGLLRFTERMKGGVWSFKEHCIKPHPEIFQILIERYGIDPGRAVFIDDREKNIKGARAVGFAALRFTSYPDAQEELGKLGVEWRV